MTETDDAPRYGAFVISLDLELHWGVRDWCPPTGPYRKNLLGAKPASRALLACFEQRQIAATWAGVGMLFAHGREELERFRPERRPTYDDANLSPYDEPVGASEDDDPIHFAGSLIADIRSCPGQEVGTQTFSHYYCMEPGQSVDQFRADIASAVSIAVTHGVQLRSIVFPRNQVNRQYLPVLVEHGITAYRGNQRGWAHRQGPSSEESNVRRAVRLVDSYVNLSGDGTTGWDEVSDASGLCNVPASRFLRPYSATDRALATVRLGRILAAMDRAAARNRIFHLWWHPHNFGANTGANLALLQRVLDRYAYNRDRFGMQSLTMAEVAERAIASPRP